MKVPARTVLIWRTALGGFADGPPNERACAARPGAPPLTKGSRPSSGLTAIDLGGIP